MSILSSLTSAQLKRAAVIQAKIEAVTAELDAVLGQPQSKPAPEAGRIRKKYKLSLKGRAAKVAGQKARWAKVNTEPEPVNTRKKSKFSAAGLARLKAAQKARWAKFHATKAGETETKTLEKGRK